MQRLKFTGTTDLIFDPQWPKLQYPLSLFYATGLRGLQPQTEIQDHSGKHISIQELLLCEYHTVVEMATLSDSRMLHHQIFKNN